MIWVGAMVPFVAVAAVTGYFGVSICARVAAALSFVAIIGLQNGLPGRKTAVFSRIVTPGRLFGVPRIVAGVTVLITKSTSVVLAIEGAAKPIPGDFGQGGQLPVMVQRWLGLTAPCIPIVHLSPFANRIDAMGGARVFARNASIPTDRQPMILYGRPSTPAAFVGMCRVILHCSAQVAGGASSLMRSPRWWGGMLTGGFGSVVGTMAFAVVAQSIRDTDFARNRPSPIIGVLLHMRF